MKNFITWSSLTRTPQETVCLILRRNGIDRFAHGKFSTDLEITGRLSSHFDLDFATVPNPVLLGNTYLKRVKDLGGLYLRQAQQKYEDVCPHIGQEFVFRNRHGDLIYFEVTGIKDAIVSLSRRGSNFSSKFHLFELQTQFSEV